jgi:hypothetical protein
MSPDLNMVAFPAEVRNVINEIHRDIPKELFTTLVLPEYEPEITRRGGTRTFWHKRTWATNDQNIRFVEA